MSGSKTAGAMIVALFLVLGNSTPAHAAAKTPNVIVILSDDYGYGSSGCYGADGKLVKTPNIDRIAKEGRRFTDANTTSSVCSPTRYSVLTGRYCWRTSLHSEVLSTFAPLHIEPGRLNMASMLKSHGYRTAAIGKWHLGYGTAESNEKYKADFTAELKPGPLEIGFDYHFSVPSNHGDLTGVFVENHFVYGLRSGKIPAGMRLAGPVPDDDNYKATYTKDDTESKKNDPISIDAPRRVNERVMNVLTDKAVHFIAQQKADPFFLYFTPVAVHNPVTPDKDLAGKSAAGLFGDWIHELDRSVGKILDVLDKQGIANETLLIFSSDNGGVKEPQKKDSPQTIALEKGLAVNGQWRGGKHHIWEGGFKVPFIVRWPGKAPAGTTCDEMVSLADILATTAAVVGDTLPPAGKAAEDSYNMLPAILGETSGKPIRNDMIVHSSDGVFAIRKGPWKWIEGVPAEDVKGPALKAHASEFKRMLFNTKDDPTETKDVSADHPEIVQELEALVDRYRDGGYSRETPPATPKKAKVALPPVSGKVLVQDKLDKVPTAPWAQVRGTFKAKDGAVWISQKAGEQQAGALRGPMGITDGILQYDLLLPAEGKHTLRLQLEERSHVFMIDISPRKVTVAFSDGAAGAAKRTELAHEALKLAPDAWTTVRITFAGKEMKVQVGDVVATASNAAVAESKNAFALMASGKPVGFRNALVTN